MKFVLGIFLILVSSGCDFRAPINQTGNDESSHSIVQSDQGDAYQRVFSSGTLKVGYIAYPPSFIINPNNETFSGISNDILVEAAKKLGLSVEYAVEVSWGNMIDEIRSGKVDIIATTVWPTAARGKFADFTTPLFYSVVQAYVRADDNRFDGKLHSANRPSISIATMDGEMSLIIAQSDFPKAKIRSLSQTNSVSELALMVVNRKADVTFLEPAIAEQFISKNPGKLKAVENAPPLRIFANVYMLGKGEYRLKSTLDTAIGELVSSRFVDRILDKYEEYPGSFVRVSVD